MRRAQPDPIRVVEAAYAWEPDEGAWLDGVLATMGGYDVGGGVFGIAVCAGETRTEVTSARGAAADQLAQLVRGFSPSLAHQAFAPTEFVGNTAFRLSRLASAPSATTEVRAMQARVPPGWAVIGGDPATRSVMLYFPAGPETPSPHDRFPHTGARALGLVGAHLGAALRLRRLARPVAADDADAVLSPTGKLLHADESARGARESLVEVVLASERARRRTRRATADEALREWTALVQGRWTILDSVERDGKRLILARRNRHATPDLLELSADERDVAWLAARGHSYKYIAYELGCPLATVASRLRRAMRKLGAANRRDLLRKLGTSGTDETAITDRAR